MEKVSIRPNTTDIIVESDANELNEVFSYNYGSLNGSEDAVRRLGSLFLVGQIQPKNDDTSYVLNLIAGLAKREYYLPSNDEPKQAFSKTLKKINEALEDFFKDRDLKINIGVFSVAGENMHVSKLGKFRILIARDSKTIDVLNDISLFNKDKEKDTQFSSIISGKIIPGDKILAFYPSRSAISREKTIKAGLLVESGGDLLKSLKGIREKSDKFSLAGIHLDIIKFKEPAIEKKPRLPDNKPNATTPEIKSDLNVVGQKSNTPSIQVAVSGENDDHEVATVTINSEIQKPPLIIPSEFGVARKPNIFSKSLSSSRKIIRGASNLGRSSFTRQVLVFGIGIVLLLGLVYGAQYLFFKDTDGQLTNSALDEIETNLKLAKTKITQNDIAQARKILSGSLLSIISLSSDDEDVLTTRNEILSVLDEIDGASSIDLTLVSTIDSALYGNGFDLANQGNTIGVLTETGKLVIKEGDTPEKMINLENSKPDGIFGLTGAFIISDIENATLSIVSLKDGSVKKTDKVNYPQEILDIYFYESNLYAMTSNDILRIIDAANGKSQFSKWFSGTTNLPPSPALIAVDGDILVLDKSGTLSKYFKGEKISELNINLLPDENTDMLTTAESKNIFIVNKKLGRIYAFNKTSGALDKVLKINNSAPILEASIDQDSNIYVLTSDNKVWKVTP